MGFAPSEEGKWGGAIEKVRQRESQDYSSREKGREREEGGGFLLYSRP
jgi:hypothetical protein